MTHPNELDEIKKGFEGPGREKILLKARSHQLGLGIYIGEMLSRTRVSVAYKPFAAAALRRQSLATPAGKQGYDERLLQILKVYQETFGTTVTSTLWHVAVLEELGFSYDDPRQTAVCLMALKEHHRLIQELGFLFRPGDKNQQRGRVTVYDYSGCDVTRPETSVKYAKGFLSMLRRALRDDKRSHEDTIPTTSPEVLCSVVDLAFLEKENSPADARKEFEAGLLNRAPVVVVKHNPFRLLHFLHLAGMKDAEMRKIREAHNVNVLVEFARHVRGGWADIGQFDELIAVGARSMSHEQLKYLLQHWSAAGKPGTLQAFKDAGGSQEDWDRKVEEDEVQRKRALEESLASQEEQLRAQRGSGKKRKHTTYVPPTRKDIDFDGLESQLEIHPLFFKFDEACVRAVIVRGFLKHGDRLPKSLHEAEQRDAKKLWKATRTVFGSRREFNALMKAMEQQHVVLRKGGKYQLHWPGARFPEARAQVLEIKKLLARA